MQAATQPLTKDYIINRCKIVADNSRAKKLTLQTSEKVARSLRVALMNVDGYWDEHQLDFTEFPMVITTLYCKQKADPNTFLAIKEIMDVFKNR